MTGRAGANSTLRLCVVGHDGVSDGVSGTLALNLAVAAALGGARVTLPAGALPPMLLAAAQHAPSDAASSPAAAARALPLVELRGDGTALLSPRACAPARDDTSQTVTLSIVDCEPRDAVDAMDVRLLPVTSDTQLARIIAARATDAALPRIVLPRILARKTDRWALVDRAVELAGDALCLTTVPFGRRDRITLYAPATRAAHAYSALLAELGGTAS